MEKAINSYIYTHTPIYFCICACMLITSTSNFTPNLQSPHCLYPLPNLCLPWWRVKYGSHHRSPVECSQSSHYSQAAVPSQGGPTLTGRPHPTLTSVCLAQSCLPYLSLPNGVFTMEESKKRRTVEDTGRDMVNTA